MGRATGMPDRAGQATAGGTQAAPTALRAAQAAVLAALLLLGFSFLLPAQFADPFIRHDDWPGVTPAPDLYWWKTLAKGRWLNWAWMLRPWPTGPGAVWLLYMALWCGAAAFVAVGLFRADRWPLRAGLVALAVAAMPQTADISAWPATTLPATAMLCLQAGVACLGTARQALAALFLTVPLALMSHSAYPLLLLLATALAADWRGTRAAWLQLPLAFLAALALGIAAVYALNWAVHGHAGIDTARWLQERPARDLAGLAENAVHARDWLWRTLRIMAVGSGAGAAVLVGLAALAAALLLARGVRQAGVLLAAGLVALGLGLAPAVLQGVETPARATGFLWLTVTGFAALAFRDLALPQRRAVYGALLGLAAAVGAHFWHHLFERVLPPYQAMTRALAAELATMAPEGVATLVIAGQIHALPDAAELRFASGLAPRMRHLAGVAVHVCDPQTNDAEKLAATGGGADVARLPEYAAYRAGRSAAAAACSEHGAAVRALPVWPAPGHLAKLLPGVAGLRLPERRSGDTPD